ncbi:MAG: hypothetical protein F6K09_09715 [Merismopedia sp. SIO2A8]|nr:hypothetical protein [Merismopedia sp. SIO2A8]
MSLPQRSSPPLVHHSSHRSSTEHHALVHSLPTSRPRQKLARQRVQRRLTQHKELAFEVSSMMAINLFISLIAIATIAKLLPHNASQHHKLRSLEAEVNALDRRVNDLRHDFTNYFDPQQSRVNMRHLSDRLEPGQRKIIFSEPPETVATEPDQPPVPTQQEASVQRR